jgi:hypothetical protein
MMPRHIFVDYDTMDTLRDTGVLNLPKADRDLIEILKFSEEEGSIFGRQLILRDKWTNEGVSPRKAQSICVECLDTGYLISTVADGHGNTLTVTMDTECCYCQAATEAKRLLPAKYQWVDYRTLKPFADLPIPVKHQQTLLDQIRSGDLDGQSILFSGPSRTGKTVLASALCHRMVEDYIKRGFYDGYRSSRLPIYRINADRWLAGHLAYDTWDRESRRSLKPEPNIESVLMLRDEDGCGDGEPCPAEFPPILFLEELDKFKASEYKLDALFTVMNAVFEAGGMIVATSNLSEQELKDRFPDWFYRRLVEGRDGTVRHRDLFRVVGKTKPPKAKKEAANGLIR